MADDDYQRLNAACFCGKPVRARAAGSGRPPKGCEEHSSRSVTKPLHLRKQHTPPRRLSTRPGICALAECGKAFEQWLPHAKYCSSGCSRSAQIESMRQRQQTLRDRSARKCKGCGSVFAPTYGDKRRDYCAVSCRESHHARSRPGSTHRRRAKKFGVEYQPIDKWAIFERDDWKCQLCGVKTPRAHSGTRRDTAPQLDHIIPFGAGGSHVSTNVQCACQRCNLKKHDRPLGQTLLFG